MTFPDSFSEHLSQTGCFGCVKLILQKGGVNVNLRDNQGNTPLHLAAGAPSNSGALVELLLASGADPSIRNATDQIALDLARDPVAANALLDRAAVESSSLHPNNSMSSATHTAPIGAEIKLPAKKPKMKVTIRTVPPK